MAHYSPLSSPVYGPWGASLGASGSLWRVKANVDSQEAIGGWGANSPSAPPCLACSGPVSKFCECFFQFPLGNPFKKTQAQPKQGTSVGSMFPAANRISGPQAFCVPHTTSAGLAWGRPGGAGQRQHTMSLRHLLESESGRQQPGWEEGCAVSEPGPRIFWL